jgi:hypothetical protein
MEYADGNFTMPAHTDPACLVAPTASPALGVTPAGLRSFRGLLKACQPSLQAVASNAHRSTWPAKALLLVNYLSVRVSCSHCEVVSFLLALLHVAAHGFPRGVQRCIVAFSLTYVLNYHMFAFYLCLSSFKRLLNPVVLDRSILNQELFNHESLRTLLHDQAIIHHM